MPREGVEEVLSGEADKRASDDGNKDTE